MSLIFNMTYNMCDSMHFHITMLIKKSIVFYFICELAANLNQVSDRSATLVALGTFFSHGFATISAKRQVLARAAIQFLRRSTTAARRLQYQI